VMALAECERGFLLQPQPDGWRVLASQGLSASGLLHAEFSGSTSAVERALAHHAPVVINDTRLDPGLARRASVVTGGIRSLLALPVLHGNEVLALIYADRSAIAEPLTEFDVQLLQAFCERAALWIVARRGMAALTDLPPLDWPSIVAAA
jgi:GAF domain-containing protein